MNYYRAMATLPAVTETAAWSDGDVKHGRYIAENRTLGHTEDPANPWYTPEGAAAGLAGNVAEGACTARGAVDLWMAGPFHAIGIIDPRLTSSGFGAYTSAGVDCGAALDIGRGRDGPLPAHPVAWPGPSTTVPLYGIAGDERPDPLSGCLWSQGTGLPLILQLPADAPGPPTADLKQDGTSINACVYDGHNYVNPDAADQSDGRSILLARHAIVVIPQYPLRPGSTYDVRVVSGSSAVAWSFRAAPVPPGPPQTPAVGTDDGQIAVGWAPPGFDGGLPVTGYQVRVEPGGRVVDVDASTRQTLVTGLDNGRTYTVSVVASNDAGAGPPAVLSVALPRVDRLWLVDASGGVIPLGNSPTYGASGNLKLNRPVVGMAARPSGKGYWLVAGDGGIFSYGDAQFFGSTGSMRLNRPIVGVAATPTGGGYWFVAADGGIFSFGDAQFFGSTGSMRLNQPIVGMAPTATGKGYWLVAADGGIFSYGDAQFFGSTGSIHLNQPIAGMAATRTGGGYWFVAADGGVFTYGDARFFGSAAGSGLGPGASVVGMSRSPSGAGYLLATNLGQVAAYGDAVASGPLPAGSVVGIAGRLS